MGGRTAKGDVSVVEFQGRLRLRWSYLGKRYTLTLGIPDNPINRQIAQGKAKQIAVDMASGHFDLTLSKYKPKAQSDALSIVSLFDCYHTHRRNELEPATHQKYQAISKHLKAHFLSKPVDDLTAREAEKFRDWLLTFQKPVTVRDRLTVLNACWRWAIASDKTAENPWDKVKARVESKTPDPFTDSEVKRILEAFESHRHYRHYSPYVRFLMATGCRTGEAIGLRWQNLSERCDRLDIVERLGRDGEWKDTKNHRVRSLALSPSLQSLLLSIRPAGYQATDLVFSAPRGGAINSNNFRSFAWKNMLKKAGVPYRKPYNSRHTALSHAIARGVSPARVAEMAGDRIETVLRNYVGNVEGLPESLDY